MTLVRFGKKLRFLVQFHWINRGFSFSVRFFCTVCRLLCMHSIECAFQFTVDFRAELVQLIVSRSDSLLEIKCRDTAWRKILWSLIVSCCTITRTVNERMWKTFPKPQISVFWKPHREKWVFGFLHFEVCSLQFLENRYPKFSSDSAHPYIERNICSYFLSSSSHAWMPQMC